MPSQRQCILIIAVDPTLQTLLGKRLKGTGFQVRLVEREMQALELLEQKRPALIVLDLSLPGRASFALCRELRERSSVPIMVFSPEQSEADLVEAFACGANRYIAVPLNVELILAQMRAALRAQTRPKPAQQRVRHGVLEIDLQTRQVTRHGLPVPLSPTEWNILELLLRQPGELVSQQQLLQSIWGESYKDERNYLRTYIGRLRAKLEQDPATPRHILTEPRLGYRFATPGDHDGAGPGAQQPVGGHLSQSAPLPAPLTRLIGRKHELEQLRALLHNPHVRLITLTGPGGSGKTHLALELAALAEQDMTVAYVPLATLRDPQLIPALLAHSLGLKQPGADAGVLGALLREQQLLLVLDGAEHLVAAVVDAAGQLLSVAPRLTLLVTSRVRLNIAAEHEVVVQPLAGADPHASLALEDLLRVPAVALFVERARALNPELRLSHSQALLVVDICRQLDHLPLGIELAAARTRILSIELLHERLDRRLALLTTGPRSASPGQGGLRAAVEWSYGLLTEAERELFVRLAVFAGGCSLEAIEAVVGAAPGRRVDADQRPLTLDLVESLLDQSLLQERPSMGEPRIAMLETIREYALEQLGQLEEAPQLQEAHARYMLGLVERAVSAFGTLDELSWAERINQEHENVRAALSWALGAGMLELALPLVSALWRFWQLHGYLAEGRHWCEQALVQSAATRTTERARVLLGTGWLAFGQTDLPRAAQLFEEALELSRVLDDARGVGLALHGIGEVAHYRGDTERARQAYEESLALFQQLDDAEEIAWSLIHLGKVTAEAGRPVSAEQLFSQSKAIFQRLGHRRGVALASLQLGWMREQQGAADAHHLYQQARLSFLELGDTLNSAWALVCLGGFALRSGALDQASAAYQEALLLYHESGAQLGVADCLEGLAAIAYGQGAREQAARLGGAAEALRQAIAVELPLVDRPHYQHYLADQLSRLVSPELRQAWRRGQTTPLAQLVAEVLGV